MFTKHRHELRPAKKSGPGTLVHHAFSLVLEVGGWGGWRFGVWWGVEGREGFTCQILDILSVREVKERRFKEALEKLARFSKPNPEAQSLVNNLSYDKVHIYVQR